MKVDLRSRRRGGKHRAAPVRERHRRQLMLAAVVLFTFVLIALGWRVTGGRWLSVDSPSMGEAAPVGTLVLTRPTHLDQLRQGDIISFTPTGGGPVHTHRVERITLGQVFTKGDINGAEDPRPVAEEQLVGKAVARWWGLAWLVKSLPILIPGSALVWLATRWTGSRWRTPLRLVGYPLVVCAAIVVLRPLVNASLLTTLGQEDSVRATVVSTGLLPIRVQTPDDVFADLRSGQVSDLVSHAADAKGQVSLSVDAHMSWLWWTVCFALCSIPLAASVYLGLRANRGPVT